MIDSGPIHPRDRFITVYGRKPVLEALENPALAFGRLLVASNAKGDAVEKILKRAKERRVELERCGLKFVNRISKNRKHDQGVALDIIAKRMNSLDGWLKDGGRTNRADLLLLDGVNTPANVGLLIRSATAFGLDGIIIPRKGSPPVSPLVVKASAGTALSAPILKAESVSTAIHKLRGHGFHIVGVDMQGLPINDFNPARNTVWVLGNETDGLSHQTRATLDEIASIPMVGPVESLNVACAGSILMFDIFKRKAGC